MQLVRDYVQNFYSQNHTELEEAYVGITAEILKKYFHLFSNKNDLDYISAEDNIFFDEILQSTPLEYIIGEKFFFRSPFYVNQDVLIPRNETEILVEDSLTYINNKYHSDFRVAEVGVGSFALGLSVLIDLKNPIDFWGGDISSAAIGVARTNLFRLKSKIHSQSKINLSISDRLEQAGGKFDLIISNPPYIREKDRPGVHQSVHVAEPHLALYLPDDIYNDWFHDFFMAVKAQLKERAAFLMEGHEDTLRELKDIAINQFKSVKIKQDYTGRDRFLHCYN
jgi:release factor glutamine methyltransferase